MLRVVARCEEETFLWTILSKKILKEPKETDRKIIEAKIKGILCVLKNIEERKSTAR
jgi:hypothetical protein